MQPTPKSDTRRKPYVAPSIQVVQADPVGELLQVSSGPCGTVEDLCGTANRPPLC
jgi:hypothetical protein